MLNYSVCVVHYAHEKITACPFLYQANLTLFSHFPTDSVQVWHGITLHLWHQFWLSFFLCVCDNTERQSSDEILHYSWVCTLGMPGKQNRKFDRETQNKQQRVNVPELGHSATCYHIRLQLTECSFVLFLFCFIAVGQKDCTVDKFLTFLLVSHQNCFSVAQNNPCNADPNLAMLVV